MKKTLTETLILACSGLLLALAANALSPLGLKLSRNYFPKETNALPVVATSQPTNGAGGAVLATNKPSRLDAVRVRIEQAGMRLGDSNQVMQAYADPRYQQGLLAFIDARDDAHYAEGHIPAAYQLDYYRPEKYLETVLPVAMMAQEIVVYCNGGECEDSEFAARLLRDGGIPPQKLMIYGGGFHEWKTNGWPIELGARNSGQITNYPAPPGKAS